MAIVKTALERITGRRALKKKRKAQPTKPNRIWAAKYNRELQEIVNAMIEQTNNVLPQLLVSLEHEYVTPGEDSLTTDGYALQINSAIRSMSSQTRSIQQLGLLISSQWANRVNSTQKEQFYKNIQKSIGVNLNGIINEEGITDIIESTVAENVSLIQSLPDEYYKKLNTIVNGGTTRGEDAVSLIKQIQQVGIQSKNRAKLIARDQTQKLNAAITQSRQEALGITEYEWQTSEDEDERVRKSHRENNGKIFQWNNPPSATGHPGQDVNCRCVALPIIDITQQGAANVS